MLENLEKFTDKVSKRTNTSSTTNNSTEETEIQLKNTTKIDIYETLTENRNDTITTSEEIKNEPKNDLLDLAVRTFNIVTNLQRGKGDEEEQQKKKPIQKNLTGRT